ncbi:winged helix DNA-binding domain-containing protein [Cryptosporangium arvum]|uniref:Winged helix DNA-binding domain-containing protein n=1 Tax=Cryptosporangium arvum DSM 44712 TaxID=927661 RepID=A0A010ZZY6_9ACTN|nr:winged helix DNA-binding domain-containing protein [Cryptosporangium arvum]EXG82767.1 hypothetical protein CryarDRAFT_3968 [Cryptosporangium arvum DSM 44712]
MLSTRALNRATLARQLLLERADVPVLDAVAHLGGLQAQEPQEPFIGLWSRLRGFDPAALSGLLVDRRVVRTHLMRRTVHLLPTDDVLAWRSRFDPMLRQRLLGVYRRDLDGIDLDALAAEGARLLADGQPRTTAEVGRLLSERRPGPAPGAAPSPAPAPRILGETVVTVLVPTVQLPPRGLWGATGGVRVVPLETWVGRAVAPDTEAVGEALIRRYLAAFGPAATADLRAWCGLAGLPRAVAAVRDALVSFRDERRRELLDLPDAPRPDPDTPAPVRFLPAFDNAILGYDDRTRIVDDAHRGLSVAGERAVLVDGRVAALWTARDATVEVTPLRRFSRAERTAVAEEGRRLATFLSGGKSSRVRVNASPR